VLKIINYKFLDPPKCSLHLKIIIQC